jgi:hypothetical protein
MKRAVKSFLRRIGWHISYHPMQKLRDLEEEVQELRFFVDPVIKYRTDFGFFLNKNGILGCGVEVGVRDGGFSDHLLKTWQGGRLYSVDPWRYFPNGEYVDIANVEQKEQERRYTQTQDLLRKYGTRSEILRKTSKEAVSMFDTEALDFVYIDAQHHYEAVREDLQIWWPKIRQGGILAGHDYIDGEMAGSRFGVKQAVDEFTSNLNLDIMISHEQVFPSFFIQKDIG